MEKFKRQRSNPKEGSKFKSEGDSSAPWNLKFDPSLILEFWDLDLCPLKTKLKQSQVLAGTAEVLKTCALTLAFGLAGGLRGGLGPGGSSAHSGELVLEELLQPVGEGAALGSAFASPGSAQQVLRRLMEVCVLLSARTPCREEHSSYRTLSPFPQKQVFFQPASRAFKAMVAGSRLPRTGMFASVSSARVLPDFLCGLIELGARPGRSAVGEEDMMGIHQAKLQRRW